MARMFRVLLFCNKCYQMILKKPRMILGALDHRRLILLIPGLLETVPHIAKKCHLGRDAQLYGRLSSIFLCGIKDPDICPILRIPESSDRSMFLCFRDRRSKKVGSENIKKRGPKTGPKTGSKNGSKNTPENGSENTPKTTLPGGGVSPMGNRVYKGVIGAL